MHTVNFWNILAMAMTLMFQLIICCPVANGSQFNRCPKSSDGALSLKSGQSKKVHVRFLEKIVAVPNPIFEIQTDVFSLVPLIKAKGEGVFTFKVERTAGLSPLEICVLTLPDKVKKTPRGKECKTTSIKENRLVCRSDDVSLLHLPW